MCNSLLAEAKPKIELNSPAFEGCLPLKVLGMFFFESTGYYRVECAKVN